jgi:hypothetical protein
MKIQTNSKKPRFWKEKSVEDVVTLGPTAQATIVDSEMFKRFLFLYLGREPWVNKHLNWHRKKRKKEKKILNLFWIA